jgi:Holliday junction resolvase RusA-like endonuclease
MQITIRKPPALNKLYGTNKWGSKYVRPDGKAFKQELCYMIRATGEEAMEGEVELSVILRTCRHQDIDSILKILFDSIQESGIIEDDYQIFKLTMTKEKVKKEDECIIFELNKKQPEIIFPAV